MAQMRSARGDFSATMKKLWARKLAADPQAGKRHTAAANQARKKAEGILTYPPAPTSPLRATLQDSEGNQCKN